VTSLSPFFKYFGSKARSGHLYPKPHYDQIREDFCGGAGYALNYPERNVILRDSDERVVRIWKYLIAANPDEIMALPLLSPGQSIKTLNVSDDARLFLSCCVNTSPFRNVLTQWKNGQNDGLWGVKWRAKVASQVDAIKHWQVEHGSYVDSPNDECTRFADPPYESLADHYSESRKNPIDYAHLGQWCRSRRGQAIVCEQHGAKWLPFRFLGELASVRNSDGRTCEEAIWTNDDQPIAPEPERPRGQLAIF
jgi:hypothetical protein